LEPGALESANISVTSAMVQMISAHRGFQAYTKVAGAIDEMNKDAVTQLVK
jgi:flagellar basal-body rod protein FlgG